MKSLFGKRLLLSSVFCAAFIILLLSCGPAQKREPILYTTDIAELISQSTAGLIRANDTIQVKFVDGMVDKTMIGKETKSNPFSFEPGISGTTVWTDASTLTFTPSKPLKHREKYYGKLHMKDLFAKWSDQAPQIFEFEFDVASPEIISCEGDFYLKVPDDPSVILYKATLSFSEPLELEQVKDAFKLTADGKRMDTAISKNTDGTFSVTSEEIKRTAKRKIFTIVVDKKPIDMSDSFKKTFNLEPLGIFIPTGYNVLDDRDHPSFSISFSDDLDIAQDVTGLVRVEPAIPVKIRITEKSIYLSGDFVYGETYSVTVDKGVRSKWGTKTQQKLTRSIKLKDLKPQISFSSDGVFLPSSNSQTLRFQTVNVKNVNVEIKKVFENNLGQFLQTESLSSIRDRNTDFDDYYVGRVGVVVWSKKLAIGDQKNTWQQHEIDIKDLLKKGDKALYLVTIYFNSDDMIYQTGSRSDEYYEDSYYSDPESDGYLYRHGRIYKPVIQSDIGLTYKKAGNKHLVFASDLITAKPLSGVKVSLFTYQNEKVDTMETNANGFADFPNPQKEIYYVVGEKDTSRTVIKCNEMNWNLSTFDIGGEKLQASGIKAFIYTERGVYRPGDPINFSVIVRNEKNTFPDGHPVTVKIYNPKNQLFHNQTQTTAKNGLYVFPFTTRQEDMTGNWRADFAVGSDVFSHTFKVETVVANRLRINVEPSKQRLNNADTALDIKVVSQYLMGNPASGLETSVTVRVDDLEKTFKSYPGYRFTDIASQFTPLENIIFDSYLNENGEALVNWSVPDFNKPPSALSAEIETRVVENGGRGVVRSVYVPVDPYPYYVGLEKPAPGSQYGTIGSAMSFKTVCVNPSGNPVSGRTLTYTIYKNSYYWWWEYDEGSDRHLRFKSDNHTEKVTQGTVTSMSVPATVKFIPEFWGEYLLEVQDEDGHISSQFFSAYYWGDNSAARKGDDIITVKTNRSKYRPGETAVVSFPAPAEGIALVSVEKGNTILFAQPYPVTSTEGMMRVNVKITEAMLPNAYISVSIIQPHEQTKNDRPMRMYGIVPVEVEDAGTHHYITLSTADRLEPNKPFTVDIQTADGQPTQCTVAVVDEGLLDLTDFRTPDPWKWFFRRETLSVTSFDMYDHVIGANKGDIFKRFSVGGDMDSYRLGQQGDKTQRFKPVCMFKGPITTDASGHASVNFEMPNYIGSVRVMVIAADNNRYGNVEKAVPVKTPLMILPTLPRFLGANDEIKIPVTVFAAQDDVKDVTVTISATGPVTLLGEKTKTVTFTKQGDKDLTFALKAQPALGKAVITITAVSGSYISKEETEIGVQPPAPRMFDSITKDGKPGSKLTFTVPDKGVPGSNTAVVRISRMPKLNIGRRLEWLIHYPYGCVEQTTSSVFPQLYLKDIVKTSDAQGRDIDRNINAAIKRLSRFQLSSGGFSYWPGSQDVSIWGTNYAGHFLYEAKQKGYDVPEEMIDRWLKFQKSRSVSSKDSLTERVYRLYLLALAGAPQMGPMNIIRENEQKNLSNLDRWLLGGAYKLAGSEKVALELIRSAVFHVKEYYEFGGTYGSAMRDKAMMLDVLVNFQDWKNCRMLFDELAARLDTYDWYSTQTIAYSLLAMGKYMNVLSGDPNEKKLLDGTLTLPDGTTVPFSTENVTWSYPIDKGFGKTVTVALSTKTNIPTAFVSLEWSGIPNVSSLPTMSSNLALSMEFINEEGVTVNPALTTQGDRFWAHITVTRTDKNNYALENCALVQILPTGWEIENTRLSGEDTPSWAEGLILNRESYTDIRDDRVMWFFDYPRNIKRLDFIVKINAVTAGTFALPSTLVETMYNNDFRAVLSGKQVIVQKKD